MLDRLPADVLLKIIHMPQCDPRGAVGVVIACHATRESLRGTNLLSACVRKLVSRFDFCMGHMPGDVLLQALSDSHMTAISLYAFLEGVEAALTPKSLRRGYVAMLDGMFAPLFSHFRLTCGGDYTIINTIKILVAMLDYAKDARSADVFRRRYLCCLNALAHYVLMQATVASSPAVTSYPLLSNRQYWLILQFYMSKERYCNLGGTRRSALKSHVWQTVVNVISAMPVVEKS